ncbi:hypothetical protein DS833_05745 [Lactobacillus bombicola]|uniref:Uncharacterized protein n=1 Tax=Lactobacillus bombicola TaxID=1505723 RepID=A0ABX9LWM6_9LACO|nr:hypothetical protein DS833_05745 [Lactobacillus bombicola]RHW53550.1 hypothetical protein DS834_01020 [Lactobacillus bombicola]
MHDVSNLIQVCGYLLGAIATFFAVVHKSHKEEYDGIIDDLNKEIAGLKKERDQHKKDYQIEHDKRIEAESQLSKLQNENFVLKEKYNQLKAEK